jgi:hypothetical protein
MSARKAACGQRPWKELDYAVDLRLQNEKLAAERVQKTRVPRCLAIVRAPVYVSRLFLSMRTHVINTSKNHLISWQAMPACR